ncbi:hypothetical protein [Winogradskyella arenosi]|uniref:DUF2158 domain-containing protein n=1 Tax=Winogradskyella arenosi TaxID=533325 RepID=A0A368ZFA5_9FLAO|nr:hypothetical protein [Winogradskyella arenosi]RCW90807.1 hypothetical protein DFQ08_104206 [Winogradskyella arenosi]
MPKKFKPGDWVRIKGKLTAPKMQVLKYTVHKAPLLGVKDQDTFLECVWYSNGKRYVETFHQNALIHHRDAGGLFKTYNSPNTLRLT